MADSLTSIQIQAVDLLAEGMTVAQAAKQVGVTRQTVYNWQQDGSFLNEIERRKNRFATQYHEVADKVTELDLVDYFKELGRYRQARMKIHHNFVSMGVKLAQKVSLRVEDLPEEAIGPKDIAPLINAALSLVSSGFDSWAETISLEEIMKQLENRVNALQAGD